jgi:protein-tyrosine kinase
MMGVVTRAAADQGEYQATTATTFSFSEKMVVISDPESVTTESFRSLRSNLLAQHLKLGRRALALCAPAAETGCSYVAANLAVTMAAAGINTLLIDGDLRSPSIADYIVPSDRTLGLAECLHDDSLSLSRAIASVQPNLSVLYAGQPEAGTLDRLGAPVFRLLIDQCLRDFDLTLIDTPPSNQFADGRRIASAVRYAAVVTCRDRSYVHDVEVLLKEIAADGGRVIGTYLNDY